jgi:hypothetical protein
MSPVTEYLHANFSAAQDRDRCRSSKLVLAKREADAK